MKSVICKLLSVVVLSICVLNLLSASEPHVAVVDRVKVKIDTVSSPNVNYSGTIPTSPVSRKYVNSWYMITVDFYGSHRAPKNVDMKKQIGKLLNVAESRYFLDDVEVSVKAICESASAKDPEQHVLFSGVCRLFPILLDNRKHSVLFFLPPQLLDRYYVPKSDFDSTAKKRKISQDNATFTYHKLSKNKLVLEVVISCAGGSKELAREYINVKGVKQAEKQKNFNLLIGKVPSKYNLEGAVLSKGQSPWAYFRFDQFDMEKKSAR